MKRIADEAQVWADGYSFVEFERTGTGLVPYDHALHTSSPRSPSPDVELSVDERCEQGPATCMFLA